MSMKKNLFIVFEGIDGSGKTSLAKALTEKLNSLGLASKYFYEPTHYKHGLKIRAYLKEEIPLTKEELIKLFLLDRKDSVNQNIIPNLKSGRNVILDRYFYSMAAYQASSEFPPLEILSFNTKQNFPSPEVLFFLDIPIQVAYERIHKRDKKKETFESLEELKRIVKNYNEILPHNAIRLNALKTQEELLEETLSYLRQS